MLIDDFGFKKYIDYNEIAPYDRIYKISEAPE